MTELSRAQLAVLLLLSAGATIHDRDVHPGTRRSLARRGLVAKGENTGRRGRVLLLTDAGRKALES